MPRRLVTAERHVKVFKNGRNRAVRIPREFEFPGEDAVMRKEGDRLIIEPAPPKSLLSVLATLSRLDENFAPIVDEPPDLWRSLGVAMAVLNIKNLPDSLYRKLQARAKRQHRSVAQEVTHLLSDALETPKPLSILGLKGLGKEHWRGVDPSKHVERERASWD